MVIVGHAKIRNRCGGVEGGSKLKLDRTGFSANKTVGLLFKIVLTLFWKRSMVAERSSFAKSWGGQEENRLRGERISRLATAPFLYTFSSTVESQPRPQD